MQEDVNRQLTALRRSFGRRSIGWMPRTGLLVAVLLAIAVFAVTIGAMIRTGGLPGFLTAAFPRLDGITSLSAIFGLFVVLLSATLVVLWLIAAVLSGVLKGRSSPRSL